MYNPTIPLIFVDAQILVINKPSGLLSLPDGYNFSLPHVRTILEPEYGRLWIVHRLDKDTSGLMILARTKTSHRILNQQFQERQIKKIYHAVVHGNPDWDEISLELPLLVDGDRRHRTIVCKDKGKPAITDCKVLHRWISKTLLSVHPLSGYTHQIRAHLSHIGFPLLSDTFYGAPQPGENDTFQRVALHSYSIEFSHPATSRDLNLTAPYPPDFEQFINQNQPIT